MTNLNQLQSELAALTERVNSAMAATEDTITLTRDELKQLINKATQKAKDKIEQNMRNIDLSPEDYTHLELNDREIEVDFDSSLFISDIIDNVEEFNNEEIEDSELDDLLESIKEA
jgi:adenylosuccinate lyase